MHMKEKVAVDHWRQLVL